MKRTPLPTQQHLNELLRYDALTGKLFWKPRSAANVKGRGQHTAWNKKWANKEAFTSLTDMGYKQGSLQGGRYLAHRIIWKMIYGTEPNEIDHDDQCGSHNTLDNLFEKSHQENMRNQRRRKDNTSGTTGVYWQSKTRKWWAYIRHDGRMKVLGGFEKKAEAITARKSAEVEHNFHPNHGREKAA